MTQPGKISAQAGIEPRVCRGGRLNHTAKEAVLAVRYPEGDSCHVAMLDTMQAYKVLSPDQHLCSRSVKRMARRFLALG